MKIILDDKSYLELKEDIIKNKAKLSIKTKVDNKSMLITIELEEEQISKLISELVSIKAGIYGRA